MIECGRKIRKKCKRVTSTPRGPLYGTRNNQTTEEETVHLVRKDFEGEMICQLNTEEWAEIFQSRKGGEGDSVKEQCTFRQLRTVSSPPKHKRK